MVFKMREYLLEAKHIHVQSSHEQLVANKDNKAFFANALHQGTVKGSKFLFVPYVTVSFTEGNACPGLATWFFADKSDWSSVLRAAEFLSKDAGCPSVEDFKKSLKDEEKTTQV